MSLKQQVKTHLSTLPLGGGRQVLEAVDGNLLCRVEVAEMDALACSFECLTVVERQAVRGIDALKKCAGDLSKRLSYLLEPISPIEADSEGCTVLMRSNPPQKEDGVTVYFELIAHRDASLSLRRYQRQGHARVVVPAHVTREVLLRLVGDFALALGS